jgi:thioredoxin 1
MTEQSVLQADDSNFDEIVLKSGQPCLVDFWAKWCGPCKMMNPVIAAAAERWAGKVSIVKVDVDSSQDTAGQFGIQSIPTLMVFAEGEAKGTRVGMANQEQLDTFIRESLSGD